MFCLYHEKHSKMVKAWVEENIDQIEQFFSTTIAFFIEQISPLEDIVDILRRQN
jgi:hypothetical protein